VPSRRVRQHVNPLQSSYFEIPLDPLPFPPGAPIEVELGSAEALFLFGRAQEAPRGFYVGVEIRREVVVKANAAAERLGLAGQVTSVYANMSCDLPRLFPAGGVARFFVNFPDPWWKSKQQKRRVVSDELVTAMLDRLSPDGEIHVATDIFDIALDALALLEQRPGLENLAGPWSFLKQSPFAAQSRREEQCLAEGTPIWRVGFRRSRARPADLRAL
jgi:tRNA (guanine-N7-)-methyltransferase